MCPYSKNKNLRNFYGVYVHKNNKFKGIKKGIPLSCESGQTSKEERENNRKAFKK